MAAGTAVLVESGNPANLVVLHGSFVIDSASLAAGAVITHTIAVPGVRIGDIISISPRVAMIAGAVFYPPTVLAAGVVSWVQFNPTAGAVDLASMTCDFEVSRGRAGIAN